MIEVKNFSAGYSKSFVLNDIACKIGGSLIYALIGPNASCKTTFLRSLLADIPFHSGQIFLDGKNIFKMKTEETAKKVSFSPSEVFIPFEFSVSEFVEMGRFAVNRHFWGSEEDAEIVEKTMEEMDISKIKNRRINEISTGQKQRCVLAQIIAKNTDIILMDEPTAHLDIRHRVKFFRKVLELKKNGGKTLVITFHDLNDAVNIAEKFILLKNGKIAEIADRDELTEEKISFLYETKVAISKPHGKAWSVLPAF